MTALHKLLIALLAGILFAGCGPKGPAVATVKGRITAAGKPLTSGVVMYQSENGNLALTAEIGPQGEYQVKTYDSPGLPPGKYKVAVKPAAPKTDQPPLAGDALTAQPFTDKNIPEKYHSLESSGLSTNVTLEDKSYDFDLAP